MLRCLPVIWGYRNFWHNLTITSITKTRDMYPLFLKNITSIFGECYDFLDEMLRRFVFLWLGVLLVKCYASLRWNVTPLLVQNIMLLSEPLCGEYYVSLWLNVTGCVIIMGGCTRVEGVQATPGSKIWAKFLYFLHAIWYSFNNVDSKIFICS